MALMPDGGFAIQDAPNEGLTTLPLPALSTVVATQVGGQQSQARAFGNPHVMSTYNERIRAIVLNHRDACPLDDMLIIQRALNAFAIFTVTNSVVPDAVLNDLIRRLEPQPFVTIPNPLPAIWNVAETIAAIIGKIYPMGSSAQRTSWDTSVSAYPQSSSTGASANQGGGLRTFWLYRGRDRNMMVQLLRDLYAIVARDARLSSGALTTQLSNQEYIIDQDDQELQDAVTSLIEILEFELELQRVK
jgi:hypothetical protein